MRNDTARGMSHHVFWHTQNIQHWLHHYRILDIPLTDVMSIYLSLLASRSDSKSVRMSPSLTGPFTLRIMLRFCSPRNSTLTWVHWPWDPVRPRTLVTRARVTCLSILSERGEGAVKRLQKEKKGLLLVWRLISGRMDKQEVARSVGRKVEFQGESAQHFVSKGPDSERASGRGQSSLHYGQN